jgi:hypothetical protein
MFQPWSSGGPGPDLSGRSAVRPRFGPGLRASSLSVSVARSQHARGRDRGDRILHGPPRGLDDLDRFGCVPGFIDAAGRRRTQRHRAQQPADAPKQLCEAGYARGGTRTLTLLRAATFKIAASTSWATRARRNPRRSVRTYHERVFVMTEGLAGLHATLVHRAVLLVARLARAVPPSTGRGASTRLIVLSDWQRTIAHAHPDRLIRGLMHTDGCRFLARQPRRGGIYTYSRYSFSNRSEDVKRILCEHLDRLGVGWTRPNASRSRSRVVARWLASTALSDPRPR